jgi:uncharacterized protein YbbK (DUF523 family)
MKEKLLISACLTGVECNYKGKRCYLPPGTEKCIEKYDLIPVCPEQLGGLSTPRDPSEIKGGTGLDVIHKRAEVYSNKGINVTDNFLKGAYEAFRIARLSGAKKALLQTASPSCGCLNVHSGAFDGSLKEGMGVTAAFLSEKGFSLIDASLAGSNL